MDNRSLRQAAAAAPEPVKPRVEAAAPNYNIEKFSLNVRLTGEGKPDRETRAQVEKAIRTALRGMKGSKYKNRAGDSFEIDYHPAPA